MDLSTVSLPPTAKVDKFPPLPAGRQVRHAPALLGFLMLTDSIQPDVDFVVSRARAQIFSVPLFYLLGPLSCVGMPRARDTTLATNPAALSLGRLARRPRGVWVARATMLAVADRHTLDLSRRRFPKFFLTQPRRAC